MQTCMDRLRQGVHRPSTTETNSLSGPILCASQHRDRFLIEARSAKSKHSLRFLGSWALTNNRVSECGPGKNQANDDHIIVSGNCSFFNLLEQKRQTTASVANITNEVITPSAPSWRPCRVLLSNTAEGAPAAIITSTLRNGTRKWMWLQRPVLPNEELLDAFKEREPPGPRLYFVPTFGVSYGLENNHRPGDVQCASQP